MRSFLFKYILALFMGTSLMQAQLIVVNSTGDEDAVSPATSPLTSLGTITLASAIQFANANADPSNVINFNIPTSDPGYSTVPIAHWTIAPFNEYLITKPLTIDGYAGSPAGAAPNTDPLRSNAIITIEISGINRIPAPIDAGFYINLSGNLQGETLVQGLCINSFMSANGAFYLFGSQGAPNNIMI